MIEFELCRSIHSIEASDWNGLFDSSYPFTQHAFLAALENSGSANAKSGWTPAHIVGRNEQHQPVIVAPCYMKYHSYGEYVFDWSWANAYQQNGLEYYPKLLCAIPFTPATGPRIGIQDKAALNAFMTALPQFCEQVDASGCHVLFPPSDASADWQSYGWAKRQNTQYHWYNEGYNTFDDFLAGFTSRKRKTLKRERSKVIEQGLICKIIEGIDADENVWESFYTCYQVTYLKRSGHQGYLTREFFMEIAKTMAHAIVLNVAYDGDDIVACALCFKDDDTLYGRYWGCLQNYDQLHFELCYYQGIEYCIANNLQHFDPGAQGEHKIQRGFRPITTISWHYLKHQGFHRAVEEFCQAEAEDNSEYQQRASELLPFKACE